MYVEVRNGLMGLDSVVLPHTYAGSLLDFVDSSCSFAYKPHDCIRLRAVDIENGRDVSRRDNQDM